jgi:hypothetical protein
MTAWANLLIPAGSVVAGGLVTGSLTLWGQALVNKGTHKREREARHDAFKVRQREIERDALLALQDALSEAFRIYTAHAGSGERTSDGVHDRLIELQMTVLTLSTRVPLNVGMAASKFNHEANIAIRKNPSRVVERGEVADAFANVQALAGDALMRDL